MNLQILADGCVAGSLIALGAAGVTLTYGTLRFGHFAHGELLSAGAYMALLLASFAGSYLPVLSVAPDGATATPALLLGLLGAAVGTGLLALAVDALVYRRLRGRGQSIAIVMASFGVSMALRAIMETMFGARGRYYSEEISIAVDLGVARLSPDRLLLVGVVALVFVLLGFLMTRSRIGQEMRAVGENPELAAVVGIDVPRVIRATWWVGGTLAGIAGVGLGLLVQVRPSMGAELLLPMFAAAIAGGLGSLRGALVGGLLVGIGEAFAVALVGAEWRAAVAFTLIVVVLLVRPAGLYRRAG
jgi:branched-chain amino acid transport system permease protein